MPNASAAIMAMTKSRKVLLTVQTLLIANAGWEAGVWAKNRVTLHPQR
jgi:hypothetical protein